MFEVFNDGTFKLKNSKINKENNKSKVKSFQPNDLFEEDPSVEDVPPPISKKPEINEASTSAPKDDCLDCKKTRSG